MEVLHIGQGQKLTGDLLSVGITAGALVSLLPAVAAALSIVWTGIRIWETETVQRLVARWRQP